jgi:hypothetical protein
MALVLGTGAMAVDIRLSISPISPWRSSRPSKATLFRDIALPPWALRLRAP